MGGRQRRHGPRKTETRATPTRGATNRLDATTNRMDATAVERGDGQARPALATAATAAARGRHGSRGAETARGGRSRRALDEPPHGCARGCSPLVRLASATTGSRAAAGPDDRRGPHRRRHERGVAEKLSNRRPEAGLGHLCWGPDHAHPLSLGRLEGARLSDLSGHLANEHCWARDEG